MKRKGIPTSANVTFLRVLSRIWGCYRNGVFEILKVELQYRATLGVIFFFFYDAQERIRLPYGSDSTSGFELLKY